MNPGTSYTGKPVRRLKLPKIGPTKTKSLFEEYFYALLAVVFFAVAVLGKAGGFSGFNALVVGSWVTAFLWFAKQLKGYFAERSKAVNEMTSAPPAEAPAQAPKGLPPLPPGMKPMIGPQWPVKPGARPAWPRLPKQRPAPTAQTPPVRGSGAEKPTVQTPVVQPPPNETASTPAEGKKQGFVYERPTLPDRRPKLPHNWVNPNNKKPNNKNPNNKKPKP
jgi:hypothetical protein